MYVAAHLGARIWGGAEIAVCELLRGLAGRGHRVVLYAASEPVAQGAAGLGLEVRRALLGGDAALHHAVAFARQLRRDPPDVLLVGTFRKLLLASLAGRLAGVPRVVARIGLETDHPRNAKYRFALRHWVDAVVTNAGRVRAEFERLPGWGPGTVTTILPAARPLGPAGAPRALRRRLEIPDDAVVVGALARLASQKRLDRLVDALALLPARVHALVAGEGELRGELEALAVSRGVADRLHLPGFVAEPRSVLESLDLYVVCSDREGFSNGMLEALTAGVPVVSTRVSGSEEALAPLPDGSAPGELVHFSAESLAAVLARLAGDAALRERMGEAARGVVAERFAPARALDAWERVLAEGAPG